LKRYCLLKSNGFDVKVTIRTNFCVSTVFREDCGFCKRSGYIILWLLSVPILVDASFWRVFNNGDGGQCKTARSSGRGGRIRLDRVRIARWLAADQPRVARAFFDQPQCLPAGRAPCQTSKNPSVRPASRVHFDGHSCCCYLWQQQTVCLLTWCRGLRSFTRRGCVGGSMCAKPQL
jgi:hypothetical protein